MIRRIDLPGDFPIIAASRFLVAVCGMFRTYEDYLRS